MFEAEETCLCHSKVKGIAISYNVDITLLESVINTCITERLFVTDGEVFWSETLRERKQKFLDLRQQKSDAGRKGMAKRWGSDNAVITENNKVKEKKEKESKKDSSSQKFSDDSPEIVLSEYLYQKILANDPKARDPNFQEWAGHIDKLMRIDGRTEQEIKQVIDFCQSDPFWKSNILSTKKLREKFSGLVIKSGNAKRADIAFEDEVGKYLGGG